MPFPPHDRPASSVSLQRTSLHLAEWLSGEHHGSERSWSGVATLGEAGPDDVSFLSTTATSDGRRRPVDASAHPGRTCITVR